jgi:hypothetical protein
MDQKGRGSITYFKAAAVEFIRHDVKGLTKEEKGDEGKGTEIGIFALIEQKKLTFWRLCPSTSATTDDSSA